MLAVFFTGFTLGVVGWVWAGFWQALVAVRFRVRCKAVFNRRLILGVRRSSRRGLGLPVTALGNGR